MKRISILLAGLAFGASIWAAAALAKSSPAELQLRNTKLGKILVDRRGFTLYAFTRDKRNHDACVKLSGCVVAWPLVATHGKPIAGPGVKAKLIGTTTLKHDVTQVTYAGHPLYRYFADGGPGETGYVNVFNFGGRWPALNAAGQEVK